MPEESVTRVNVDLQAVGTEALSAIEFANQPAQHARFAALPKKEFDLELLSNVALLARGAQYASQRLATLQATTREAMVPAAVMTEASELRAVMMRVCEYHLRDEESALELADIRRGTGYLDLAQDLRRLAVLYRNNGKLLEKDNAYYDAGDAAKAEQLSDEVAPKSPTGEVGKWKDASARAFTLLLQDYNEVRAAALWLFRHESDNAERFPNLFTATRAGPKTTPKPQPNGNGDGTVPGPVNGGVLA